MRNSPILFVLLFLVTSCGIKTNNSSAIVIPENKIPPGIVEATSTSLSDQPVLGDGTATNLYFLDQENNLVPVARKLSEPTISNALDALTVAPLAEEISIYDTLGLVTQLPRNLNPEVEKIDTEKGELTIRVSDDASLSDLARSNSEITSLIFSQLVCTVDGFLVEGQPIRGTIIKDSQGNIRALDSNRAEIIGPATIQDFNNCEERTE